MSSFSLKPRHQPQPVDLLIIGGGPAGLCAAVEAAPFGLDILVVDENDRFGGQLVKQTHKFFGSKLQRAGTRGLVIGEDLVSKLKERGNVRLWGESHVLGIYPDGTVTLEQSGVYRKFHPQATIVATGAAEKFLPFPGNDLPGVYGAGAVQTLMNLHGVLPAKRLLMVGAGNIGLIVSYQLLQAGCEVAAIVEGLPKYGGYQVHASKIARAGVPILTRHTILEARGSERVEGAVIAKIDDNWQPIAGTEQEVECDAICLAIGLSPQNALLRMAGTEQLMLRELSGWVPKRNAVGMTTVERLYVAGDAGGIEEASSAMIGGRIAGLDAVRQLGLVEGTPYDERMRQLQGELAGLRAGPEGKHIRSGMEKAAIG